MLYRTSRFLQLLALDDSLTAACHGFRRTRAIYDRDVASALRLFEEPMTFADFAARVDVGEDLGVLRALFASFLEQGFLVRADVDERVALVERLQPAAAEPQPRDWELTVPRALGDFRGADAGDLHVLLLGGCLTALAADTLRALGPAHGYRVTVATSWPTDLSGASSADVVVWQPFVNQVLHPLWDDSPFLDDEERAARLDHLRGYLSEQFVRLRKAAPAATLLVHGIAAPRVSPHGRTDFRLRVSFAHVVASLNEHVRGLAAPDPGAFVVDEERISADLGKARVWDDLVEVYSHHGTLGTFDRWDGPKIPSLPRREVRFGAEPGAFERACAMEYFACHAIARGTDAVKCVLVDLDNTLWHGIVGESSPGVIDVHHGIHQALRILKSRGVLLATCSRNDREAALATWTELHRTATEDGASWVLHPDDFVAHEIHWGPKTESVQRLSERLGVATRHMAFVDDNPVERAQVEGAFPDLLVLGDDLQRLRGELLGNPRFETNVPTAEARSRSEMVKAQLRRDDCARSTTDRGAFLRGLDIRMVVTRLRAGSPVARVVELGQRTNQFNTTQPRYTAADMEALLVDDDARVYTLDVSDRFGRYGLVGLCVLRAGVIENVAVSCRVLPLEVGAPFVTAVMERERRDGAEMVGLLRPTERNLPCRSLFLDCGFRGDGEGRFVLDPGAAPRPIDHETWGVTHVDGAP